jgi:Zn-dependent protease
VGLLVDLAFLAVLIPALVLVHELGHALMAASLGRRVRELRVGSDDPVLTVRAGGFSMRLGAIGKATTWGYVRFDGSRAKAWHVLLIALAGPLVSLAAGVAAGAAMIAFQSHRFVLMVALVGGLQMGVDNLRPRVNASGEVSDGAVARLAWRAIRG